MNVGSHVVIRDDKMNKFINTYAGNVKINNEHIKSCKVWISMRTRCCKISKNNSTYKDCTICEEWFDFANFKKWFDNNYRYDLEEKGIKLALDKDLLSKDKKNYSPDTCVFLPYNVNAFLSNKYKNNKSGYIGVTWHKNLNKWEARINDFETRKIKALGVYKDLEKAGKAYKDARKKEAEKVKKYLKELNYDDFVINKIA